MLEYKQDCSVLKTINNDGVNVHGERKESPYNRVIWGPQLFNNKPQTLLPQHFNQYRFKILYFRLNYSHPFEKFISVGSKRERTLIY